MYYSRQILGIRIDFLSKNVVLSRIRDFLLGHVTEDIDSGIICTTNPEFVLEAKKDAEFAEIINNSFLSVPDGVGVVYAKAFLEFCDLHIGVGKAAFLKLSILKVLYLFFLFIYISFKFLVYLLLGKISLEKRISGADLVYDICSLCEKEGLNVFLLGGWPKDYWGRHLKDPSFDLAEKTAVCLQNLYPHLQIVGATSVFSPKIKDDSQSVEFIQNSMSRKGVSKTDIMLVCYGHSSQEKWLKRNMSKIPAKLGIGLGGTFDFISGLQKRSPEFFIKHNIEWLFRLVKQPWRFKRVFRSTVVFSFLVMRDAFLNILKK